MRDVAIVVVVTVLLIFGYMTFYAPDPDGASMTGGETADGTGAAGTGSGPSGDGLSGPGGGIVTGGSGGQAGGDTELTQEELWALEDARAADRESAERNAEVARTQRRQSIEELASDGQPLPGDTDF